MLSKKIEIALLASVNWNVPPLAYGPWEKVIGNLAKGLVAAGYSVHLFATNQARIPGAKIHAPVAKRPVGPLKIHGKGTWEKIHVAESLKLIDSGKVKVDIIHNHVNYYPLLFAKFLKIPMVTTTHGATTDPEVRPAFAFYRRMPFVSISRAERAYMPELNYVGTVYNPIDFDEFTLFLGARKNYLAYAGRMHPDKGIHHAISLAKTLRIPLYLAGPKVTDAGNYFEKEIAPYVDNKLIYYLGNLSALKVRHLISRATAYVGMIDWAEPFGLTVAEAMASGTPVIVTPKGSHKEIVIDGTTGILVNSVKEAVRRFPELAKINAQKCRALAQSMYDIQKSTQGYLKIYEKLLTKRG